MQFLTIIKQRGYKTGCGVLVEIIEAEDYPVAYSLTLSKMYDMASRECQFEVAMVVPMVVVGLVNVTGPNDSVEAKEAADKRERERAAYCAG